MAFLLASVGTIAGVTIAALLFDLSELASAAPLAPGPARTGDRRIVCLHLHWRIC